MTNIEGELREALGHIEKATLHIMELQFHRDFSNQQLGLLRKKVVEVGKTLNSLAVYCKKRQLSALESRMKEEKQMEESPELWPTPRAGNPGSRKPGTGGKILAEEVKLWRTPQAQEAGARTEEQSR